MKTLKQKLANAYAWVKKKVLWFFLGSVALAAGVDITQDFLVQQQLNQQESLYAHIENGVVDAVIVISTKTITEKGGWYLGSEFKPLNEWIKTSNKGTIRKNYAKIGGVYDKNLDAFITPKPTPDATFDSTKAVWIMPTPTSSWINSTST